MSDHHDHSEHHDHPIKPYVMILLALLGLTGLTVGVAFIHFGEPWADIVAFTIAVAKATLVVSFFMHVRGSSPLIKVAAVGGFLWLLIFFSIILTDYFSRTFEFTS